MARGRWLLLVLAGCAGTLRAATPHTVSMDGRPSSGFFADERLADDTLLDSKWQGSEVEKVYAAWDGQALFLGITGSLDGGNKIFVYLDVGPFGDWRDAVTKLTTDKSGQAETYWRRRNHFFPAAFRPDFLWEISHTGQHEFYVLNDWGAATVTAKSTGPTTAASVGWGVKAPGEAEIAIPWSVFFSTLVPSGVLPGTRVKLVACVVGGPDNGTAGTPPTSAHDGAPNQQNAFAQDAFGPFTFDTWFVLPVDANGDGVPDSGIQTSRDTHPPAVPRSLEVTAGRRRLLLSWSPTREPDLAGYQVAFATSGVGLAPVGGLVTGPSFTLGDLVNETTYFVQVTAVDTSGNVSDPAGPVAAMPYDRPVIAHAPVTAFAYRGRRITLTAVIADPENPVTEARLFHRLKTAAAFTMASSLTGAVGRHGDSYTGTIPADATTGDLEYYLWAVNQLGRVEVLPAGGGPAPFLIQIPLSGTTAAVALTQVSVVQVPDDQPEGRRTELVVPAGATDTNLVVRAAVQDPGRLWQDNQVPRNHPDIAAAVPAAVYDFTALDGQGQPVGLSLRRSAALALRYFDEDGDGTVDGLGYAAGRLRPFFWDGTTWVRIAGSVDRDRQVVRASVQHLSRFALFAATDRALTPGEPGLRRVIRPTFMPALGEAVEFDLVEPPPDLEIDIYDVRGARVRRLPGTLWDGRDEQGRLVESGPYLYQVRFAGRRLSGSCVVVR